MTTPAEYSDLYNEMVELHWKKEETVTVKKSCIVFMDDSYGGAVFLQQVIFWNDKGGKKDGWFYKSHTEWYEEVLLKRHLVDRYGKGLELAGVLETEIRMANGKPTKHYRINKAVFHERWKAFMLDPGNPETHIKFPSTARAKPTPSDHLLNSANAFSDDHLLNSTYETPEAPAEFSVSITEDSGAEAEDREDSFFQKEGELENPSIATPQDSVSPIMEIPEFTMPLVNSAGALHNVEYPAQVFAELLSAEPTPPVKGKSGKAAKTKAPKSVKPPKEPSAREAAFIAEIEKIDPFMAQSVRTRCGRYYSSEPWSISQVFLLTGNHVPAASRNAVVTLNGTAFNTELMLKCLSAWTSKGGSLMNLAWLLEWYKAGGPPQYVKYGQQQQTQPAPAPSKAEIEFDSELVVDVTQWIKAMPGYGSKSPRSIQLGIWAAANGREQTHLGNAEELLAKYLSEKGQDHATQTTA